MSAAALRQIAGTTLAQTDANTKNATAPGPAVAQTGTGGTMTHGSGGNGGVGTASRRPGAAGHLDRFDGTRGRGRRGDGWYGSNEPREAPLRGIASPSSR